MKFANRPTDPNLDAAQPIPLGETDFAKTMAMLLIRHRPSRMPFFRRLAAAPSTVARNPLLLGRIHLNYQAAMHATRAAVYHLPHLDSPALRRRKLQIFIDDDGLAGGDTHHYQLTRAFGSIGATFLLDDEAFGEPAELCRHLEAETARFVGLAATLYARSLGPWCVIETLSVDWMRALAEALSVHFPGFGQQPYFAECFTNEVEERHAAEALAVTQSILDTRPELIEPTLRDAATIARALDGVWRHLDRIVRDAIEAAAPDVKPQSRHVGHLEAGSIDQHTRIRIRVLADAA
jgi:hypothetical protein